MTDPSNESSRSAVAPPERPVLSLWDASSLMIGIVVGVSLFAAPRQVFSNSPSPAEALWLWAAGGILSVVCALLFAELAVSIPRGGSYAYLTEAFGRTAGLVYGVALVSVMLTANIGAMAFAFARYALALWEAPPSSGSPAALLAAVAVFVLAVVNTQGLRLGRATQNLLTASKLLGLALIILAGLATATPTASARPSGSASSSDSALAMVIVLYAFGGWSDAAAVAAEVKNRARNIPRTLIGGLAAVTVIYVTVNWAYVCALGFEQARQSNLPAYDVMTAAGWGPLAGKGVSLLVMISALGAVQGMLFSGARAVAAMGADHSLFRRLGAWNQTTHVPTVAVWTLALISLLQIAIVGTAAGQTVVNRLLSFVRIPAVDWTQFGDGFDVLVYGSAPTFWALMIGVGIAFFRLRALGRTPTEFRAPGGPVVPGIYLATCLFMFWRATTFAAALSVVGVAACVLGLVIAAVSRVAHRPSR
jgi:basic amino acid/polyamine antiporter, APA family